VKITGIELFQIHTPRYYGQLSGHVLVKLQVDHGPVGWGEASDSIADDLGPMVSRYRQLLLGQDATRITQINTLLRAQRFGSKVSDGSWVWAIDLALLYPAPGPGLGVEIDEAKLRASTVASA